MKKISSTKRILLIALGTLLVAIALYGWLFFEVWKAKSEIVELSRVIGTSANEEVHLRTTEDLLESTKEDRAKLTSYFVTEESVVTFIEAVEALGRNANVSVTTASVETADSAEGDLIGVVQVRTAVTGTWRNTIHFLTLAEGLPYAASIVDMELTRPSGGDGSAWRGSFTLNVALIK